jgi:hypothetical protein
MVHTHQVKRNPPSPPLPFHPLPLKSGKEKEILLKKKTYTTQSYLPSRNLPTYVDTHHGNR